MTYNSNYLKFILLFFALFLSNLIFGQPIIEFQRCFGGSLVENLGGVTMNSNGGFVFAGGSTSSDGQVTGQHNSIGDFWIVNMDSTGNLLWESCFGGSDFEFANSIAPSIDGGSVSCGLTYSNDGDVIGNHGSVDAWLIKLDSLGNLEWKRCYGGSKGDFAFSIINTFDQGYLMGGFSTSIDGDVPGNHRPNPPPGGETSDVWLLKLDSLGDIQWSKNYGSMGDEVVYSVIQTSDSGYAFLAVTASVGGDVTCGHGYKDYWLCKIDKNGNLIWNNCFGGTAEDQGYSLKQTLDQGFILAGMTSSHDGDVSFNHDTSFADIWVVKTDQFGNLEWEKSLGGTSLDEGKSVIILPDSTYLIGSSVLSTDGDVIGNHGSSDFYLANINQSGQLVWSKCYGGAGADWNTGLIEAGLNNWLMIGYTSSNNGDVSGNHGSDDYWAIKLTDIPTSVSANSFMDGIEIYPNPFQSSIAIKSSAKLNGKIRIMNVVGDLLLELEVKESREFNLSTLADGIYFLEYTDSSKIRSRRIVKMN